MKRTFLLVIATALIAVPAAVAKGPSAADINGPGTGGGISIGGNGEGPGSPLGNLTEQSGFFPATFGQEPDPMLRHRPKGDLGPKYTITFTVPNGSGEDTIRMDVYPYAKPNPVTYTPPGQDFFQQETRGGWYVSWPELKTTLVGLGLPARPSAPTGGSGWWPVWAIAAAVFLFAALAAATVRSPRGARPDRSPAPRRRARDRLLPAGDRGRPGAA